MRVGTDTGGTFTDLVADDGRVAKVPSTPDDPGPRPRAPAIGATRPDVLTHGTTVATNALLERAGATVALVTNQGLADVIEIGRQDRPSLYDQTVDRPEPLVPRRLRYEVAGRLDATGAELEPVDLAGLPDIDAAVEAVAVVLLHADLEPAHEQAVAAALRSRGHDVSESHQVSPEFREVERTVTTVANAYLRPVCRAYLEGLAGLADQVAIMTSAGGLVPVDGGRGPAGGPGVERAGGRCPGRGGRGGGQRLARRRDLRHGRHQHRRVPGARRSARARGRADGRGLRPAGGVARRAHHRGRRRVHRLDRRRRGPDRRSPQRGGRARSGLLRAGRHPAHRDRRRPGGRPPAPRPGAARPRCPRPRRGPGRARRGRGAGPGGDRGGGGGHDRGRPGRDGGPRRRPPRPGPGGLRRGRAVACLRPGRRPGHGHGDRAGPGRGAVGRRHPVRRRAAGPGAVLAHPGGSPGTGPGGGGDGRPGPRRAGWSVRARRDGGDRTRLPLRRAEPRAVGAVGGGLRGGAPPSQRLRPGRRAGRGGGHPGPGPATDVAGRGAIWSRPSGGRPPVRR